jgi:hypothetical protein
LRAQLKTAAERLSGDQIWIERSSNPAELQALMRRLAPRPIKCPLIRIGGPSDGGYLVPDDLEGLAACVSPGVSSEVGFDLAMAERGVDVFMTDASVPGPPIQHDRFHFERKFLDVFEDDNNTRLDSLSTTIDRSFPGDRILQMDIEGAEYRVLLDTSDQALRSFRIMVMEFHHLTRMLGAFPFGLIQATFRKLLRHHHVVHIHPNNVCGATTRGDLMIPPVMEFTFYRKDRALLDPDHHTRFPHQLDRDNVAGRPSVALPICWR